MIQNITKNIYYVGVKNPDLRIFDVIMHTKYGTTYNAYVVKGKDKVAVFETVKDQFSAQHIKMIQEVVELDKIDYIVMSHTEPDHSGSLVDLLEVTPNATVVGSRSAIAFLPEIVNHKLNSMVVKDTDTIDLGGITLEFIMAPFLHWPDTMFTYIKEKKTLITGDMFGCHYSGKGIFDEAFSPELVDAQKYYYDIIISPFREHAQRAIDLIKDLETDIICPAHGPVLTHQGHEAIERFKEWSKDVKVKNAVKKIIIPYVSAYGYTQELAETAKAHLKSRGFDARLYEITSYTPEELIAKIDTADGLLIGSPTFNRDALPPAWTLLMHVSAYRQQGLPAAAFGSYGWSGEAVKMLQERMRSLGLKVKTDGFRTRFKPSEQALEDMKAFVDEFVATM